MTNYELRSARVYDIIFGDKYMGRRTIQDVSDLTGVPYSTVARWKKTKKVTDPVALIAILEQGQFTKEQIYSLTTGR